MKQHPHAEILRAIADGVPLSEVELTSIENTIYWDNMENGKKWSDWIFSPDKWKVRRKPRTHVVNGFTVPAPMDKEPPPESMYFYPTISREEFANYVHWATSAFGDEYDRTMFSRGLCFATKEAAIANAKAMLKIDPEAA